MKKKIMRCLALAIMFISLGLCFTGCDFSFGGNSNGGNTGGGTSIGGSTNTAVVEGISVSGNIKTDYCLNESLDVQGAKLKIVYSDDSEKEISLYASMVSGFNTNTTGSKVMTITYKSKTCTVNYIVDNAYRVGDYKLKMGSYYHEFYAVYNSDGSLDESDSEQFKRYTQYDTPTIITFDNDNTGDLTNYTNDNGERKEDTPINIDWRIENGVIKISAKDITYICHTNEKGLLMEMTGLDNKILVAQYSVMV